MNKSKERKSLRSFYAGDALADRVRAFADAHERSFSWAVNTLVASGLANSGLGDGQTSI